MNVIKLKKIFYGLLVFTVLDLIFLFIVYKNPDLNFTVSKLIDYISLILKGYGYTLFISFISLILSVIIGLLLFFMYISKSLFWKYLYHTYTHIVLGIPLLVHVIVVYFFFSSAIGLKSSLVSGIFILSGYMAAYFAKSFEGAYNALDPQQFKIMYILGLPYQAKMTQIILPQIFTNTLPSLTSHFSLLIKSTALLSLISVPEFTQTINIFNSQTLAFETGYVSLALGYLLITVPLSQLASYLSRKVEVNALWT